MTNRYKERPHFVDAFRIGYDEYPEWFGDEKTKRHLVRVDRKNHKAVIDCNGWDKLAKKGDYVVKKSDGMLGVYNEKDFNDVYEKDYTN